MGCVFLRKDSSEEDSLAASDEWNGVTDARTTFDVAGRDRLAAAGAQLDSADGRVNAVLFSIFFTDFLFLHFFLAQKIFWHTARTVTLARRFLILMDSTPKR